MLSSVRNTFRIPDLRGKILFTLLMIALYRIGAYIPAPGIDLDAVQELKRQAGQGAGVVGFLQLFSGGALTQFALFALGIIGEYIAKIYDEIKARPPYLVEAAVGEVSDENSARDAEPEQPQAGRAPDAGELTDATLRTACPEEPHEAVSHRMPVRHR